MLNRVLLFFILFISFFSFSDNYIVNEEESVRFGLNTFLNFNRDNVSLEFFNSDDFLPKQISVSNNSVGLEGYVGFPLAYDMFLNLGPKLEFSGNNFVIYSLFAQLIREFDINAKVTPYVNVGLDVGLNKSNFNTVLGAGLVIPTNDNVKFNVALNYHYRSWYNLLNNVSDSGFGVTVGLIF